MRDIPITLGRHTYTQLLPHRGEEGEEVHIAAAASAARVVYFAAWMLAHFLACVRPRMFWVYSPSFPLAPGRMFFRLYIYQDLQAAAIPILQCFLLPAHPQINRSQ